MKAIELIRKIAGAAGHEVIDGERSHVEFKILYGDGDREVIMPDSFDPMSEFKTVCDVHEQDGKVILDNR